MDKANVHFPKDLRHENLLRFASELDRYAGCSEITLHLGEDKFLPSFAMLFLAAKLRKFRLSNQHMKINVAPSPCLGMLGHMGFFDMFNVKIGREVGWARGSEKYLPITRVRREELFVEPGDKYAELGDLIQRHADKIAEMLCRDYEHKGQMFDVLSYSIREIMRNVFEHSEANELFYYGQYWPQSNKVEVAIADLGIGIRRGLYGNPNYRFNQDKQAIEYSLLPSVSGKTHLARQSENWFNSGYGLYMTNRLARNGGNFVIVSGKSGIHMTRKTKTNFHTSFPGTILRLNFNVEEIGDVEKRLKEFRLEGDRIIALQLKPGAKRPPSGVSLLLRRDYM